MDTGDRKLFTEGINRTTEQHTGAALDAALDDLGWSDALADDPRDAVSILFQAQGRANVTSGALDAVLASALGVDPATTAVILPRLGRWHPPGEAVGDRVAVHGLATGALQHREQAAIVVVGERGAGTLVVVPTSELSARPVPGIDPGLGLLEVLAELPAGAPKACDWSAGLAAGRLAIAHELVGCSRTMLRLARDHAVERIQFGRPIAAFQAIRHRLAESLVAVEAAEAAAGAGWDDPSALSATLAKAIAGASARTVGKHAQQVLGGMGYTVDHPLHLYVRRSLVLDQLLGAGRSLTREVGEQLLRTRSLPGMLPL